MLTSGFFNSLNHDRRYNAEQFSAIFDGVITDGIYMSIGGHFNVVPAEGMMVLVAPGRAWFNHTWILNDAQLPITLPQAEVLLHRIDAIVINVDKGQSGRQTTVTVVKGTPSSNPQRPAMVNALNQKQYPLAYISVRAGQTSIRTADISNMIGTSDCPFVTGVVQTMKIDTLIAQWGDQWNVYFAKRSAEMDSTNAFWKEQWRTWFEAQTGEIQEAYLNWEHQWDTWYAAQTDEMTQTNKYWKDLWQAWFYDYTTANQNEYTTWKTKINQDFVDWWNGLKALLVSNPSAAFAMQLLDLENRVGVLEEFMQNLLIEHAIYDALTDENADTITDNTGSKILCNKVVFVVETEMESGVDLKSENLVELVKVLTAKVLELEKFKTNLTDNFEVLDPLSDGGSWLFLEEVSNPTEEILDSEGSPISGRVIFVTK